MRRSESKKNTSIDPTNIFPLLLKSHFNNSGNFTKKGLAILLKNLKDKKSILYKAFGQEGAEIFYSYYLMHRKTQKDFSVFARDIVVANSILFNELKCGPDSYTVRQAEHIFSLISDGSMRLKLKKKFITLILLKEDDLFFKPIFDSFITLYIKSTNRFGINYDAIVNDCAQLLIFTRAQIWALRELDCNYTSSKNLKEKTKILSLSAEYLKRIFMGSFSSVFAISGFFYQRNFTYISSNMDDYISYSKDFFENLSGSHRKDYFDYINKSDIIHSKLDDLREQIFENISPKKSKLKLS